MKLPFAAVMFVPWALAQPSWLVPYPGATAQTRSTPGLVESTYEAAARPANVVAHYQKLFETAGLPFNPGFDGMGTVIRGSAPECDLLIKIREQNSGTFVRVSCAEKTPAMVAVPSPAPSAPARRPTMEERIAQSHEYTRQVQEEREQKSRQADLGMAKFDQPVYPHPKKPAPPLAWPAWLVHCNGARLQIEKGSDMNEFAYLKAEFNSTSDRAAIQSFYADLLNENGYPVDLQSKLPTPRTGETFVRGSYYAGEKPGPKLVVRAAFTPRDGGTHVELRITRVPY